MGHLSERWYSHEDGEWLVEDKHLLSDPDAANLIAAAPVILRALCRAVMDGRETDKWQDHAERSVALALGFEGQYDRRELYRRMGELRQTWPDGEPILPTWKGMSTREFMDFKREQKAKGESGFLIEGQD